MFNILFISLNEKCKRVAQHHIPSYCWSDLDIVLEKLSMLAETGSLTRGIHYAVDGGYDRPQNVYLRLKFCLPELKEWAKRKNEQFEILDMKAYRRMFDERTSIYIRDTAKVKWIHKQPNRCVVIDIGKALKFGLEIEGFWSH